MKTKYLDNEIELLNSIKRNHEISDYGQEKLNEFIAIKEELLLHNVSESFSKSDLLDLGNWFDGSPEFVEEVVNDWLNAR